MASVGREQNERLRVHEEVLRAARRTREGQVATDETQRLADHIRMWAQAQDEWDVGTTLAGLASLENDDLCLLAQAILDAEVSAGSDASGTYEWPILRPCTAWASCSTIGCDHDAKSNVLHQPDDNPPLYVPFCDECIDARQGGAVIEYQMTVSGFIGTP